MAKAAEMAGDIIAAGSAVSGLILVYVSALSAGFSSYQPQERKTVVASYRRRAWFAFGGLVLFLLSVVLGLLGKWLDLASAVLVALVLLLAGFGWVLVVAILTVREIH